MRNTLLTLVMLLPVSLSAAQNLPCLRDAAPPVIDGQIDKSWDKATEVSVTDKIEKTTIYIKSICSKDQIYFLVRYKDKTENRHHKRFIWDKNLEMYKHGPTKEDSFIFKWPISQSVDDFSLKATSPYIADIWYWKAFRTDPKGYADDKRHIYSDTKLAKARSIILGKKIFYLSRPGDEGQSSYKSLIPTEKTNQEIDSYAHRSPTLSRADVKAKGVHKDGMWTIEFSRALNTGHFDDIKFERKNSYKFGVSLNEIAGAKPDPNSQNPNYGAGEVSDTINLIID